MAGLEPTPCFGRGTTYQRGRDGVRLHRAALEMKLGRPLLPGMEACHSCDHKWCVNEDHLWEGTHAQNMADARAKGIVGPPPRRSGEGHPQAKLTSDEVRAIRRRYAANVSQCGLAVEYGVSQSTISTLLRRENWKDV